MPLKITYLLPSLNPHGGIRVLVEHCNHLAYAGHQVNMQVIQPPRMPLRWIKIDPMINVIYGGRYIDPNRDVIVASTPPLALELETFPTTAKKFFFLQMAEDLFAPRQKGWVQLCHASYNVSYPIIGISRWVEDHVLKFRASTRPPMHYIGNGVGPEFQPGKKHVEPTILVEGWESYNDAKDVNGYGPRMAQEIKKIIPDLRITAYSSQPLATMPNVPTEYHQTPDQETLIKLYQEAWLLIKCTRLDARSCAPVEAMACNTTTVRMIEQGDDDLIDGYNCALFGYSPDDFERAKNKAIEILKNPELRYILQNNGLIYRHEKLSWASWIKTLEDIFQG